MLKLERRFLPILLLRCCFKQDKVKQDSKIPFFQMFLSVMIIPTESITKPKKVICFVGLSADFWVYVVKLNSLKSLTVFFDIIKRA